MMKNLITQLFIAATGNNPSCYIYHAQAGCCRWCFQLLVNPSEKIFQNIKIALAGLAQNANYLSMMFYPFTISVEVGPTGGQLVGQVAKRQQRRSQS